VKRLDESRFGAWRFALALLAVVGLLPSAHAQAPTVDFGAAAESFRDAIIPVINDVLPVAIVIFGIFASITLFQKLMKKATKA